jgi:Fe-S-cluster-containing dehydrogenase component
MEKQMDNIWIGQKDLTNDTEFLSSVDKEFVDQGDVQYADMTSSLAGNRRDFLKFLGFGVGAATIAAGCDIPVKKVIPYVVKPDAIVPGVANYYASSFVNGGDYCPVLVKTREGRPIKIEGNDLSSITGGGTSARAQASVLSLYDVNRFTGPKLKADKGFKDITWAEVDKMIQPTLQGSRSIRIITNTNMSPSTNKALAEFVAKYPNAKVVTYDNVSASALLDANQANFGKRAVPSYHFDKAEVIVSFGADFLGSWVSPIEFAADYVKGRKINDVANAKMSRHFQVESHMSLTGSNADNRILVKPSEQGVAIAALYEAIVGGGPGAGSLNAKTAIAKAAGYLKAAAGKSLVVSGSNNLTEQLMVNAINNALGNYGTTIDMSVACNMRKGNDADIKSLVSEMKSGGVDLLIVHGGCNPAYDSGYGADFAAGMAKVQNKVSFSIVNDETTDLCNVVAPSTHFLESWGDVEPYEGVRSIIQPTIAPLFNARQAELSLLNWAGSTTVDLKGEQPYYEYIKNTWKDAFAGQSTFSSFNSFWDNAVHDGVVSTGSGSSASYKAATIGSDITQPAKAELEISFFETVHMANGQYAGNPWLMEMPDPVTRTSWGNYLAVPVNFDGVRTMVAHNNLQDGDLVEISIGKNKKVIVPIIQQFGQMPGTVSLALGYGRKVAGQTGSNVGVDVNDCLTMGANGPQYFNTDVKVSTKIGKEKEFSCVQYHHTIGVKAIEKDTNKEINADEAALVFFDYFTGVKGFQGALTDRSVIYTSNANELKGNVEHLVERRKHAQHLNAQQIYRGFDEKYALGHHWGMHVDLNACIGCGACTVACMSENNVPVVGKKEVSRHHEMTWLRIDRYYYGDIDSPNTIYQPMMCQHCNNAPCENVCPVNATNHSSEGLNQMAYNRCIGTRYCANNCPYKVRRFNWLDYTKADLFPGNQPQLQNEEVPFMADNLTRMVLNPDVTVRSRGVIEKCSFCVQRIQEGKLTAKVEGRLLRDGDVKTACQTSCPTGAITFGDMNDQTSVLHSKLESPLNYIALEEINVRPAVTYTMKVVNRDKSLDA